MLNWQCLYWHIGIDSMSAVLALDPRCDMIYSENCYNNSTNRIMMKIEQKRDFYYITTVNINFLKVINWLLLGHLKEHWMEMRVMMISTNLLNLCLLGTVVAFMKNRTAVKKDKSFLEMEHNKIIDYAAVIIQKVMIL